MLVMMSLNAANGAHSEDNADHYRRLIHFLCFLDSLQFAIARLPGNSRDFCFCYQNEQRLLIMGTLANSTGRLNHFSEMVETQSYQFDGQRLGSCFFLYSDYVARLLPYNDAQGTSSH